MFYIHPYFLERQDIEKYTKSNVNGSVPLIEQNLVPEKFTINYPYISNFNKDIIKYKINNSIINEVSELFKSQVLLPEKTDFNEIFGTYETKVNKNSILSILFSMYTYVNRAAHGFTEYSSITINTQTGQIYNFSDLFNPKMYYTEFLNELAKQYINEKNIELISEYHGITPDQKFYLTEDKLVLYYQVYEYTPYYYGLFKIEIPYTNITNLLSPFSPINKILQEI